ncbi:MAG: S8 family serine peptidase [Akkermansiaceae bacterium]
MIAKIKIMVTAAILSVLSAIADDKSFGDGLLPELLQQCDINNDGRIDIEERQAIKSSLKIMRAIRRNQTENGVVVSDNTRQIIQEEIRKGIEQRRADEFAQISGHDEVLSHKEFGLIPVFSGASPERINVLFKSLDNDKSGDVNFDEFIAHLRSYDGKLGIPKENTGSANGDLDREDVDAGNTESGAILANDGDILTGNNKAREIFNFADEDLTIEDRPQVSLGLVNRVEKLVVREDLQRYIAVFNESVKDVPVSIRGVEREYGLVAEKKYKNVIRGFSFSAGKAIANGLSKRADIKYIVADSKISTFTQNVSTSLDRVDSDLLVEIDNQDNDLLSRVNVAVLDTGIDDDHPDLNVIGGKRFYYSNTGLASDNSYDDNHGHGTFVAGIIGAIDNTIGTVGVSPGVGLYAVKVLDSNGNGYTSVIIEGLDHIVGLNLDEDETNDIHVANLSIGGDYNRVLNDAVQEVIDKGVVCVVAAGNSSADSANFSPASAPNAITVSAFVDSDGKLGGLGASTAYGGDDYFASFSNYGSSIDICAPGVDILGPVPGGYIRASGTSFAAPHVSGAAALYIANSSNPYRGETGINAVKVVEQAILDDAWRSGELEYLLGGDPDGIAEPLLSVGRLKLNSETSNTSPEILISDPINGVRFRADEAIALSGMANDKEDGSLSQFINWRSNVDGDLGVGENLLVILSEGLHMITAEVSDSADLESSISVTIEVIPGNTSDKRMFVSQAKLSSFGGRLSDKHLSANLSLVDDSKRPVTDARVTMKIINQTSGTVYSREEVTDTTGSVVFSLKNIKLGFYTLQVSKIEKNGFDWDGQYPSASIAK